MPPTTPITLTWLDVNTWLIDVMGRRILVDPWLIEDVVFVLPAWVLRLVRPAPVPIPEKIDLILLSQGLADHAHPPTLQALPKGVPVVASASAAKVAQGLGFTQVTPLAPEELFKFEDLLTIQAFPGAPIGPFAKENGYVITVLPTGLRLYYEPHGYPPPAINSLGTVDVVITPVVNVSLPLAGTFIQGSSAIALAQALQPQLILPTAEGGDVAYTGLLPALLKYEGGVEQLRSQLTAANLSTQVKALKPMESLTLNLSPRAPFE
jgi:L-ascorbate metabolism protein UlaG (beta-lactamase superfamily)